MMNKTTLILLSVGALMTLPGRVSAMEEPILLHSDAVTVAVHPDASVEISNSDGQQLLTIEGLNLRGEVRGATESARDIGSVKAEDGTQGVQIRYALGKIVTGNPATVVEEPPEVTLTVFAHPGYAELLWMVTGVSTNNPKASLDPSMMRRRLSKGSQAAEAVRKCSFWERHEAGGVPYEVAAGTLQEYTGGAAPFVMAYRGRLNTRWVDTTTSHAAIGRAEPGQFMSRMAVIPGTIDSPACSGVLAAWGGRTLGVDFAGLPTYQLWESAADGSPTELSLQVKLLNVSGRARPLQVKAWLRDWDGNLLLEEAQQLDFAAMEAKFLPLSATVKEPRGIYFLEVSLTDPERGEEAFRRTNLCVLPPHRFTAGPEESVFGIAAYWPIPDEESVQRLMDRMGIVWVRQGNTHLQHPPRISMRHSNANWRNLTNETLRLQHFEKEFKTIAENGNRYWEFGNEANMSTLGIAMEGGGIGKALQAPAYSAVIVALRAAMAERADWPQIQLLGLGLAGMDTAFVKKMKECGSFDLIDGFCLHPGRGNFTPDYPVTKPWEPWTGLGSANYWNYYGSLKEARRVFRELGRPDLPLYLTEVYAPTYPNSYWEDTLRNAAENAFLTMALGQAEGVKAIFWYQLFDSVWFDRLGVNPKNREYHFGLLQHDLSLKPSAMAYVAAAETLEKATFRGWIRFEDEHLRGMAWDSPKGPFVLLWSRADGYVLTERKKPFASPEPWIDTWKTHTKIALPARGDGVRQMDCIGRETALPLAADGTVTVELTGAPVVVWGLADLPLWDTSGN